MPLPLHANARFPSERPSHTSNIAAQHLQHLAATASKPQLLNCFVSKRSPSYSELSVKTKAAFREVLKPGTCPLKVLVQPELDHNTFSAWAVTPVCFLKGSTQPAAGLNPVHEIAAPFPLPCRTERTSGVTQTLLEGNQSHTWRRPVAKQLQATPQ